MFFAFCYSQGFTHLSCYHYFHQVTDSETEVFLSTAIDHLQTFNAETFPTSVEEQDVSEAEVVKNLEIVI